MPQAQEEINHRHDAFWAHAQKAAVESVTPTKRVKPRLVSAIGKDYTDADYTDIPPSTASEEFDAAEKGYKWFGLKRSTWANLIISSALVALAGWNIDKLDNMSKALFTSGTDNVEDAAASPVEAPEIEGAKITETASGILEVIVKPTTAVDSGVTEAEDFDVQATDLSSLDKVAQMVAATNNPILEQELEAAYSSDPWGQHNLAYYMSFEMHGLTLDKQLVLDLYAEAAAQGHQPSVDNYAVLSDMWGMASSYYTAPEYAENDAEAVVAVAVAENLPNVVEVSGEKGVAKSSDILADGLKPLSVYQQIAADYPDVPTYVFSYDVAAQRISKNLAFGDLTNHERFNVIFEDGRGNTHAFVDRPYNSDYLTHPDYFLREFVVSKDIFLYEPIRTAKVIDESYMMADIGGGINYAADDYSVNTDFKVVSEGSAASQEAQTAAAAIPMFECIDYTCDNSLSETDFRVTEKLRAPSPSNS